MKSFSLLIILLLSYSAPNYGQNNNDEIIFYTQGSTFSPLVYIQGNASILWTFDDSTTSTNAWPIKNYEYEDLKINKLKVTPWNAVIGINIGYNGGDGGSDTIPIISNQKVVKVENSELVASSLKLWCSSDNLIDSLSFDNFINLETIESEGVNLLKYISLKNTPKLKRINLEQNNLSILDITECDSIQDIRASINNNISSYKIPPASDKLYHICIRDVPKMIDNNLYNDLGKFPNISELFIWNSNQSGAMRLPHTNSDYVVIRADSNKYQSIDFAGSLQNEKGWGAIYLSNNKIQSIDIEGCDQIDVLNLYKNELSSDSVDKVLRQLDEFGTNNNFVDLRKNAIPSPLGFAYVKNLESRGWIVYVDNNSEVKVYGRGNEINNGDTTTKLINNTNFDSVTVNKDSVVNNFVIKNTGTNDLRLWGSIYLRMSPYILISGPNASDFRVISEPSISVIPEDSTVFQISFKPTGVGLRTAKVSFVNNDWDRTPFSFAIQGIGTEGNLSEYNESKENKTPDEFMLLQNYPNPFNPTTLISYQLPEASNVSLKIYDILGNEIATLVEGYKPAGMYNAEFKMNNEQYGSGIYFYQLKAGNFTATKKMIMIK